MQLMSQKPDVLRTAVQLLADLDLASEGYPRNPAMLTEAQTDTLQLEWLSTKSTTGEKTFSDFLKRRLSL